MGVAVAPFAPPSSLSHVDLLSFFPSSHGGGAGGGVQAASSFPQKKGGGEGGGGGGFFFLRGEGGGGGRVPKGGGGGFSPRGGGGGVCFFCGGGGPVGTPQENLFSPSPAQASHGPGGPPPSSPPFPTDRFFRSGRFPWLPSFSNKKNSK